MSDSITRSQQPTTVKIPATTNKILHELLIADFPGCSIQVDQREQNPHGSIKAVSRVLSSCALARTRLDRAVKIIGPSVKEMFDARITERHLVLPLRQGKDIKRFNDMMDRCKQIMGRDPQYQIDLIKEQIQILESVDRKTYKQKGEINKLLSKLVDFGVAKEFIDVNEGKLIEGRYVCPVHLIDCTCPADMLISVDVSYEITYEDFCAAMAKAKASRGVIVMYAPTELVLHETRGGVIRDDILGTRVVADVFDDKVHYYYGESIGENYTHKLSTVQSWLKAGYHTIGNRVFQIETSQSYRGYHVFNIDSREIDDLEWMYTRRITLRHDIYGESVFIPDIMSMNKTLMSKRVPRILVSRSKFDQLLDFVRNQKKDTDLLAELKKFARVLRNEIKIGDKVLEERWSISSDHLMSVCMCAVFYHVYTDARCRVQQREMFDILRVEMAKYTAGFFRGLILSLKSLASDAYVVFKDMFTEDFDFGRLENYLPEFAPNSTTITAVHMPKALNQSSAVAVDNYDERTEGVDTFEELKQRVDGFINKVDLELQLIDRKAEIDTMIKEAEIKQSDTSSEDSGFETRSECESTMEDGESLPAYVSDSEEVEEFTDAVEEIEHVENVEEPVVAPISNYSKAVRQFAIKSISKSVEAIGNVKVLNGKSYKLNQAQMLFYNNIMTPTFEQVERRDWAYPHDKKIEMYWRANNKDTDEDFGALSKVVNEILIKVASTSTRIGLLKNATLCQGPGGTGKSAVTKLVADSTTLIMCATRRNKEEFDEEFSSMRSRPIVKTYAAGLVYLYEHAKSIKRVIMDEFYLFDPLMVSVIMKIVTNYALEFHAVGDREQIKFVNRSKISIDPILVFKHVESFFPQHVALTESFRIPKDICRIVNKSVYWDNPLTTTNEIENSIEIVDSCPNDVDHISVVTQRAKEKIIETRKTIEKTNTIHESQGITVGKHWLKLYTYDMDFLYRNRGHLNVAITRHTEKLYMDSETHAVLFSVFRS
jgi:hypothetical protein